MKKIDQDIICFPSVIWNFNWERQHEIIYRLAQHTLGKVYIHQPYGMINHSLSTIIAKVSQVRKGNDQTSSFANKRLDNMQFVSGKFIPYHFSGPVDKLNASLIETQTPSSYSGSIVFATYVNAFSLKLFKKGKVKILDLAQRRQKIDELSNAAKKTEEEAVIAADLVVTDSISTKKDYDHLRPDIIHLPTGVDLYRFTATKPANALQEYRQQWKTIAGYVGSDIALDEKALQTMITTFPDVLFLLVGGFVRREILALKQFPNVMMPGRIHSVEVPSWCKGFDVGLIPYAINERNLGVFPTKFLEYLASGVPVFSSALPDVMEMANEAVNIYKEYGQIPRLFGELLDGTGEELSLKAQDLASQYSWDNIFEQYFEQINRFLS